MSTQPVLILDNVTKSFTLHLQGGTRIGVVAGVSFSVEPGECVVLGGPSGAGKSSILKMIYGTYRCDSGAILVDDRGTYVDVASASPRRVLALRRSAMGYVSQFLRVIPRVPTLEIVAEAAREGGVEAEEAQARARHLLAMLNVRESLWSLPPATFSGGEQQRVNVARGLAAERPLLLLDEPTASLDADNRKVVVDLINERKRRGMAMIGIFHDEDVRAQVADRIIDIRHFADSHAA
ncbi:alpha-D-ribose 1-methylphosphonate 5-triphosphate synthase subunit PhnL [Pseudochelatococcus lubricantis]|uniref:Alpha-D-ribose 1-methylphosphonate 5-triphosphate synthase subunit PhnL n=1 Tax=Pseudochelatococcus lubricantis TaxID=1538102 RepID=A0ABX0UZW2_9HYPH|nr:phosphonate C-P lyase system protein PhnL [Pseudochelatococcus lubricantis]NIJ58496.1 alpha-D-ribose 1-methylphosphonate 5-triphosphate synthase subunit PhnL [Pseudochelatococcus lubricantis]